jgi:protein SCO1
VKRLLVLFAALLAAPSAVAADGLPPLLRDVGFDQRLGESVPSDIALRDEEGRPVHLGDFLGKRPVVLSLVYYECPMLCTLTLNGLGSALSVLSFDAGKQFQVVTVSFNPKEGPDLAAAKKKTYLQRYKRPGAAEGWRFLTADAENVDRLTRAVGFKYAWDPETKQFAHPAGILVLTPDGRIARYLYGIEYAPRDLRLALVEASAGKIGTPVDQVALYCYQYDPKTGKYSVAILNVVRLSGALTLVGLATFLGLMFRWERARARAGAAAGQAG